MKILAIGAHFDDLELGCGGSLLRWIAEGHQVTGLILTESGYKDEKGVEIRSSTAAQSEGRRAAEEAGYKLVEGPFKTFAVAPGDELNRYILSVIHEEKPDLMLTHWIHDTHLDHKIIAEASLHCARRIPRALMYRSNWYVGTVPFHSNFFVDISSYQKNKLELVKKYESEVARSSDQWLSWIEHQGKEMGLVSGSEYAEGFEFVKWAW